ncbi:MAG: hypothetical protein IJ038_00385 [Clostridia bacterium]|nr:hypothetical protein [Clostridia bacterium]
MCGVCGKYICPPPCPFHNGESAERGRKRGECYACGESLCEYDEIRFSYGKPYCVDCFEKLSEKEE